MLYRALRIETAAGAGLYTGPTAGYHENATTADQYQSVVMTIAGTPEIPISTYHWEMLSAPPGSSYGPFPADYGILDFAQFDVEKNTTTALLDGTYVMQCTLDRGMETEYRMSAIVARPSTLTTFSGKRLRIPSLGEQQEDTSKSSQLGGWSTALQSWQRSMAEQFTVAFDNLGSCGAEAAVVTDGSRAYCANQMQAGAYPAPGSWTSDDLVAIPFVVARRYTISQLRVYRRGAVVAGGDPRMRVGLYDNYPHSCYPNALLVDGGELALGVNGVYSAAISRHMYPGLYWLVCVFNTDFAANGVSIDMLPTSAIAPILGTHAFDISGTAQKGVAYNVANAYGALPNPYPMGALPITSGTVPCMFFTYGVY